MADERLKALLGPDGKLPRVMDGVYEHRPGQMEMAEAVGKAIEEEHPLLVEAGTGTGKTLAYLVPAILSGKRIVISTGTKNLQEQIMKKDLPLVEKVFKKGSFSAAMMKGRGNYLCKRRLKNFSQRPLFMVRQEADIFQAVLDWALETPTGDRAELDILPDNYQAWGDICSKPELCLGAACKYRPDCYVNKMRNQGAKADIVVVNHHLFFADLAMKDDSFGEVIPRYDMVIFDEAHLVEDIATTYFGATFSSYRIGEAARDAERELKAARLFDKDADRVLTALPRRADVFFNFVRGGREDKRRITKGEVARWASEAELMANSLSLVSDFLASIKNSPDSIRAISTRFAELAQGLLQYVSMEAEDCVYWLEPRGRGTFLHSTPIDVSSHLGKKLYPKAQGIVLTSATMSTSGDFSFIIKRLGLPEETLTMTIESPFDYQTQAALYVPRDLPNPSDPSFSAKASERISKLVTLSRGRAFILFTSHKALDRCWETLEDALPYTMLRQGMAPRDVILEKFRKDTHSVLFGAASFWQGVDVQGESLFAVIVDKLPFAMPDDPVVAARIERINKNGGSAFMEYQVPSAALALKQGLGRLIRSKSDRGFLAVLDKRISVKAYGKEFIKSLPPFPIIDSMETLEEKVKSLDGEGGAG